MQLDKTGIDINCKNNRYLVVGGDSRQLELARLLKKNGYEVATLGMENINVKGIDNYKNIDEALEISDIIIGPIPFSKVENIINSTYSDIPIDMDKLFEKINSNKIFLAGAMNKSSREIAQRYNINYIDYYWDESYQIMNAIPTAEGTIALVVNETDTTIHSSKILILGYGRIGKILADYLKALGANVYVEARKEHDIAWIKSKAMNAVNINDLSENLGQMDIIINTVPSKILDKNLLAIVRQDALLIDLASIPGGVDFEYAKERGLKIIHELGIPGKTAYKTAAVYMYDCIMKLLGNP